MQDFHFRQAAVGDRQAGYTIGDAGEHPLGYLGPGLLHPGFVICRNTCPAFDHFEMSILGTGGSRERGREMDAQAMVAGEIIHRGVDVEPRDAADKIDGGFDRERRADF